MARSLRSPAVLMAVYVALFIWGGPWIGSGSAAHRNGPAVAVAVLLAFLAARGSRLARILMITYCLRCVFAVFYGATYWGASEPFVASFLTLTCVLVQICLLVSTPLYERTRPGWSPGHRSAAPFLPSPALRSVLASAAGGLAIALVPFSDGVRETVCSAGAGRPASPCSAPGIGYPVAYRYHPWGSLPPRGFNLAAFAADWALWAVSILLVVYLLQVSRSREHTDRAERPAVEPALGRP